MSTDGWHDCVLLSIMLLNLNPGDWAVLQNTRLSGVGGNISEALYLYQQGALLFPPLKLAGVSG